jgi:hypothetical protein
MEISIADKFLMSGSVLDIHDKTLGNHAIFKIVVERKLSNTEFVCVVKHYKTKKCNKVRVQLTQEQLERAAKISQ